MRSTRTTQLAGTEKALKHEYDDETEQWKAESIWVRLSPTAIAEGTNRVVYKLTDMSAPKGQQNKVAKAAKSTKETRMETFNAVVMQKKCQKLAEKFNELGAPKKIRFVDCAILELVQRPVDHTGGYPIMILEPMLEGEYKKHSNNFGFVDKEDRNTPQAFSHFTYQATKGKMIVVDIQGVGDVYTDPQIHSNIPESEPPIWGQGDMGDTGIYKFFESHRCNALCKFFGLTATPDRSHKHSMCGTRVNSAALGAAAAALPNRSTGALLRNRSPAVITTSGGQLLRTTTSAAALSSGVTYSGLGYNFGSSYCTKVPLNEPPLRYTRSSPAFLGTSSHGTSTFGYVSSREMTVY